MGDLNHAHLRFNAHSAGSADAQWPASDVAAIGSRLRRGLVYATNPAPAGLDVMVFEHSPAPGGASDG